MLKTLSGFRAACTPSVGAFYKFFGRLENGPYQPKCKHRVLPGDMRRARSGLRKPRHKPKPGEPKRESAAEGVLADLVAMLKAGRNEPLPQNLHTRMNAILLRTAVQKSAQLGLLGDIGNMRAAGDGSVVPSYSNSWGKPTCECHQQGIYQCEHERKYSDPDADFGWDNSNGGSFMWGYRYYQLVCGSRSHDLPLALNIASANKHEAVMFLNLLDNFRKQNQTLWPSAQIRELALDAIHDAKAFCQFLYDDDIRYAIPFMHQPPRCQWADGQPFNSDGIPLCPAGLPMRRHGINRHGHIIYACPAKRPTHCHGRYVYVPHPEDCPLRALCEPHSVMGPTVSVAPENDPRLHPVIQRGSLQFKELYDSRTTCERSNSAKKKYFLMAEAKIRVMPYSFIRLTLISILEHSRAWVAEKYHLADRHIPAASVFDFFCHAGP